MALTDVKVRNAKARDKAYKIYDEKGLFLQVTPKGQKRWRFKYRFCGKEKLMALGVYPKVSLAKARQARETALESLAEEIDPMDERKKQRVSAKGRLTFGNVAREFFDKNNDKLSLSYAQDIESRFARDIFPFLELRPIQEVTAQELLSVIRRIESRGVIESAHRALQKCGEIFRYGVASGYTERDISYDLRGALTPKKKSSFATITDVKKIGPLLRAIDAYEGQYATRCALRLSAYLFPRPGELRYMEWEEIDFEIAQWSIPAEKMKKRRKHIVPLSRQVIETLRELELLTGKGTYAFPSLRSAQRPMSENTLNAALRRIGYSKDEMCGHGFRAMASTILNEQGWNPDAVERQLAHVEKNNSRKAYNYAQYLPERIVMMQKWADFLDAQREVKNV